MLNRLAQRPLLMVAILMIAAELLFLWHLDRPSKVLFDEFHYVPAARTLLALSHPTNMEHPLLAKELIAAGMLIFGDNPIGWRFFSTLAGAATVGGAFAFVWLLLRQVRPAMFAALFVILNQTVFVQARTGMLDGFMGAFVMLGLAATVWAMRGGVARFVLPGVLLGLATAVKWAAAPYVALVCLAVLLVRREHGEWFGPRLAAALLLGIVSIAAYLLTFLPAFFYAQNPLTLATIIPFHEEMYALQTQVLRPHTYQSDWWSWPLLIRPIWYFYEPDQGVQRGVLLIGNPVLMWGGLVAVGACWWAAIRERATAPLIAAGLWTFSLAIWAVIPKSLGFYYYYHLSGIFLCIALAVAFHHYAARVRERDEWFAIVAIGMFVYFYPILAASPLSGPGSFQNWMWFGSWR